MFTLYSLFSMNRGWPALTSLLIGCLATVAGANDTPSFLDAENFDRSTSRPATLRSLERMLNSVSGATRSCRGFNHQSSDRPSCELFDMKSPIGPLSRQVGERSYYFHKVCLNTISRACSSRPYAFSASPDHVLHFTPFRSSVVADVQQCLALCLNSDQFTCKSLNYNRRTRMCDLLSIDRHSSAEQLTKQKDSDHFENDCLTNQNRCEDGTVHFVKVARTRVLGQDVKGERQPLFACLNKCLMTTSVYCRSVEFLPDSNSCYLSDEDSSTSPTSIVTSLPTGTDWYEPVCLVGAVRIRCDSAYLFERIGGYSLESSSQTPVESLANVTVTHCMFRCLQLDECKSFVYSRKDSGCEMLRVDRMNANTQQLALNEEEHSDYYEVMCPERTGAHYNVRSETGVSPDSVTPRYPERARNVLENGPALFLYDSAEQDTQPKTYSGHQMAHLDPEALKLLPAKQRAQRATSDRVLRQTQQIASDTKCGFELKAQHRNLKVFYRNDHPRIRSLEACQLMCESWHSFVCRSISYSQRSNLCSLSQLDLNDFGLAELTQYDPDYDFFTRSDCFGAKNPMNDAVTTHDAVQVFRGSTNNGVTDSSDLPSPIRDVAAAWRSTVSNNVRTNVRDQRRPSSAETHANLISNGGGGDGGRLPAVNDVNQLREAPRVNGDDTGGGIDPSNVLINADCLADGVNVTVILPNQNSYSGAIYAAERYTFCRTRVTEESRFSLFLHRPTVNPACNTLEVSNLLSAVVIISNDRVLPYDVTTKDDLFYEVSCDYSGADLSELRDGVLVRGGIVVGGPTPRVVAAAADNKVRDININLRILREGRGVQNVLLGERLTLSVESSLPPERMELDSCNVTRIGGNGPSPEPLLLLRDGCPSMAQVLGEVSRGARGLEAPLVAFRIDGSAEIQIVCLVKFCSQECPLPLCDRQLRARISRNAAPANTYLSYEMEGTHSLDGQSHSTVVDVAEAVDGILRVYVPGEHGAPDMNADPDVYDVNGYRGEGVVAAEDCVSKGLFTGMCISLGALLLLTVIGTCSTLHYRNAFQAHNQHTSIPESRASLSSGSSTHYDHRPSKLRSASRNPWKTAI